MRIPQTKTNARVLVLLSYLSLPVASIAGSPTEQVRATVDRVLAIARTPNGKSKSQIDAHRAQLAEVISPRFDFSEMAKRSLGRHWAGRTLEEQREFVKVFAVLMGKSYADHIESYTTQKVLYIREKEDRNYAQWTPRSSPKLVLLCRLTIGSTVWTRSGKSTIW